MKTIDCEIWPLHNKLEASMFVSESPIGTDGLILKFYSFELALFYYRLFDVLYNILDKNE